MHDGGTNLANKSPDLSLLQIHRRKIESDSSCKFDRTLPTLPTHSTDPRDSPLDSGLLGERRSARTEHNERSGRSGCNGDSDDVDKTLLPKKFKPPAMFTLSNISTKTGDTTGAWEARPAILALACAVRWRWKLII